MGSAWYKRKRKNYHSEKILNCKYILYELNNKFKKSDYIAV